MLDNNSYFPDIFYDVSKMTKAKRISIMKDAYNKSFEWKVDKLDCSISWARQKIDMTFDEIMEMFDMSCHFVVIHRRGYESWRDDRVFASQPRPDIDRWKLEVGFSTMKGISHFLWLYVDENELPFFTKKYKLKEVTR